MSPLVSRGRNRSWRLLTPTPTNYRRPMYLKRSPWVLFQALSNRLRYRFETKEEQTYVLSRLSVLDRKYCLAIDLQLWQSYSEIGQKEHQWPDELRVMSRTDDFELCHHYLVRYIEDTAKQLAQCQTELGEQSGFTPIIPRSFHQLERCLEEYVECQRKYLLARANAQLEKFKNGVQASKLFNTITAPSLSVNQRSLVDQLIFIRQQQAQLWEGLLQLETRILCKLLPLHCDQLEKSVATATYVPLNNEQTAIQLRNKRFQMIREAKRQWLHITLSAYEIKLQEYDQQYQHALTQLESLLLNDNNTPLFNDITHYMVARTSQLREDSSRRMSVFQDKLLQRRQQSSSAKNTTGVSPEPYLDLNFNPFNILEWQHLLLGPFYIRLNQSALRPRKQQEIEIKREHQSIVTGVHSALVNYHHVPRAQPIFQEYSKQLLDYFHDCYFTPTPYKDQIQARQQAQTAASIRKKIKRHKLVIRVTDKSNNFYVGSAAEFEKKAQSYFVDTNAFTELADNPYSAVLNKVVELLDKLKLKKHILPWQHKEMMPDRKTAELAHLYFNPKTHKDGIPVRPIENTIHAATTNISKFLNKNIRPIFSDRCAATTIIDGAHLITGMTTYVNKGRMKPSTLFCTVDFHNLYTMLPQDEALNVLVEFFSAHGYRKVKGVPVDALRKLACIVLKENVFVYDRKIYRQTVGGAMGSSFTLTLANIFMWKWQQRIVRQQDVTGEFYGRYIDDVFITWNNSEEELRQLLDDANGWHPNIKLEYKIGRSLPFLDVLLTNNNGCLSTSVYHKPTAEPYVVPFMSDHPRHTFRNIVQSALTRAVRYSSTFEAFNYERRSIKLMLLYNGYPASFIDDQFRQLFDEYSYPTSFLRFIENERQFFLMRHEILGQPTPRQSQVATSVATVDVDNDQTDATTSSQFNQPREIREEKAVNYGDRLFVHYTHEKRFRPFRREVHRVYENVFKNTPAMHLRLIVGNRNRRDARNELVRKRPSPSLLRGKLVKKKYMKFLLAQQQKKKQSLRAAITTDPS